MRSSRRCSLSIPSLYKRSATGPSGETPPGYFASGTSGSKVQVWASLACSTRRPNSWYTRRLTRCSLPERYRRSKISRAFSSGTRCTCRVVGSMSSMPSGLRTPAGSPASNSCASRSCSKYSDTLGPEGDLTMPDEANTAVLLLSERSAKMPPMVIAHCVLLISGLLADAKASRARAISSVPLQVGAVKRRNTGGSSSLLPPDVFLVSAFGEVSPFCFRGRRTSDAKDDVDMTCSCLTRRGDDEDVGGTTRCCSCGCGDRGAGRSAGLVCRLGRAP
mmetsp:Transcript_3739/g.9539  ORF Transcript_3739/g.9539 Transcript_3739/m.9539 type:complete len:276 (-) Transcript_3739:483-1310(-)